VSKLTDKTLTKEDPKVELRKAARYIANIQTQKNLSLESYLQLIKYLRRGHSIK
jgi:hypothetical protein